MQRLTSQLLREKSSKTMKDYFRLDENGRKAEKRDNWFEWPYKQRKIIKGYTDVALLTGLVFAETKKGGRCNEIRRGRTIVIKKKLDEVKISYLFRIQNGHPIHQLCQLSVQSAFLQSSETESHEGS